jgi:hypothetical protein
VGFVGKTCGCVVNHSVVDKAVIITLGYSSIVVYFDRSYSKSTNKINVGHVTKSKVIDPAAH